MAMNKGSSSILPKRLTDVAGPRSRVQCGLLGLRSEIDAASASLQWHSFKKPTLEGGTYSVDISQTVVVPVDSTPRNIKNENSTTKSFTVQASRFVLQPSDVLSVYPPALSTADLTVLPSVVFAEPTLPWERVAIPNTLDPGPDQGIVPWLALIVFEKDELQPMPASLTSISTDPETGSFKLKLGDLIACPDISLPLTKNSEAVTADEATSSVDAIFLRPSTFLPLLYDGYHDDGSLKQPDSSSSVPSDVSRYQYFVHTRQALPDSDGLGANEHSVIFSHRTANASNKTVRKVAVHLVSIEGWSALKLASECSKPAVALVSLHSWTYTVDPTAPTQFLDMLKPLAGLPPEADLLKIPNGLQMSDNRMLRNPAVTTAKFDQATGLSTETLTALKTQMACGYTMTKHRLSTGEPTIALYRGPLTPVPVPHDVLAAPSKTGVESSVGKDLDIMNQALGMSDISYSSAWNLGRLLAASNKDFCDALTRIRRSAVNKSMGRAAVESRQTLTANDGGPITSAVPQLWSALSKMAGPDVATTSSSTEAVIPNERWRATDGKPGLKVHSSFDMFGDNNVDEFKSAVTLQIQGLSSTQEKLGKSAAGPRTYNELNKPSSGTYPTVLKQLLDFKFLDTIPMQYLIPASEFLPLESIRFFYIDKNWIDVFIDGALSIGNTLDVDGIDPVKAEIKQAMATYEDTLIEYSAGHHKPQIPKYGFCIRSKVITTWADVRFAAPFPPNFKGGKLEILGTKRLDKDTMMVLLDRCPEDSATNDDIPPDAADEMKAEMSKSIADAKATGGIPLLSSISIVQPPHHQSFVLGHQFDDQVIKIVPVDYNVSTKECTRLTEVSFHANDPASSIYDWKNNLIRVEKLRDLLKTLLPCLKDKGGFQDVSPLLLGLNLSSTIDSLRMENTVPKSQNQQAVPIPHAVVSEHIMTTVPRPSSGLVAVDALRLAMHRKIANAGVAFSTTHLNVDPLKKHLTSSFGQVVALDISSVIPRTSSTGPLELNFSTPQIPLEPNQIPITSGPTRLDNTMPLVDLLIELSVTKTESESVDTGTIYLPLFNPSPTSPANSGSGFLEISATSCPQISYKQQFKVDTDRHLRSTDDGILPYAALAIVISSRWHEKSGFSLRELDGALLVLHQVMPASPCVNQDVAMSSFIWYLNETTEKFETMVRYYQPKLGVGNKFYNTLECPALTQSFKDSAIASL
ncbi:unnamed protein product [Alternaria alternata]